MKITILDLGSTGDVLPYAILGKGLKKAGHQVRMVTFEGFRELVEGYGITLFPIAGDFQAILNDASGLALSESGGNVLRGLRAILEIFVQPIEDLLHVLVSPAVLETDAIINQLPGSLFGYDLAEKIGIPHWAAAVAPLIRTSAFPISLFPQVSLGSGYNWLSYRLAEQMAWQPLRARINRWRREELNLSSRPFWGYFHQMGTEHLPVLGGFSRHVVPQPSDWPEHVHVTGYWFSESDATWQPPEDLQNFLDAGSPPIYIGFGSTPIRNPEQPFATVMDALQLSGQRAILSGNWSALLSNDLPESIIRVGFIPHDWLFPRLAGIVTHGGAGTTAAALRAGVPVIVVPFLMDQFYWGRRIFELGVGPRPTPFKRLTSERLAAAISTVVNDSAMRERAVTLGTKIHSEDGVAQAVKVFDQYIRER